MPDPAIDNDAPTQPIGQVIIPEEAPPPKAWKTVALGALLGVMLALGGLALTRFMVAEGGQSFVGWIGGQVHDAFLGKKVNNFLERKYGPDAVLQINANIKPAIMLGAATAGGLGLGALAGLLVVLVRRGRLVLASVILGSLLGLLMGLFGGAWSVKVRVLVCVALALLAGLAAWTIRRLDSAQKAADEPRLPAVIPVGLAVLGIFTNGFIWGNVAVLLLPYSQRRRGITVATWIIGAVAVIFWACGLEFERR